MPAETSAPDPDPISQDAADLAHNDWHHRLNAAGTPLAKYFNYSGMPLGFPDLGPDEQLVFDYEIDGEYAGNIKKVAVIKDHDEMCQWFNAGRLGIIGVGGWRIVKQPEDPSA